MNPAAIAIATTCPLNGGPHVIRKAYMKIETGEGQTIAIAPRRICRNCGLFDTFIQEAGPEPHPPRMPP